MKIKYCSRCNKILSDKYEKCRICSSELFPSEIKNTNGLYLFLLISGSLVCLEITIGAINLMNLSDEGWFISSSASFLYIATLFGFSVIAYIIIIIRKVKRENIITVKNAFEELDNLQNHHPIQLKMLESAEGQELIHPPLKKSNPMPEYKSISIHEPKEKDLVRASTSKKFFKKKEPNADFDTCFTITVPQFIDSTSSAEIVVNLKNSTEHDITNIAVDFSDFEDFFKVDGKIEIKSLRSGMEIKKNIKISSKHEEGIFPVKIKLAGNGTTIEREYTIKVGGTEIY